MKIKHYLTAFSNDVVKLDREVNELLSKGYQPYGNPYLSDHVESSTNRFLVCQAMVLFEESFSPELRSSSV